MNLTIPMLQWWWGWWWSSWWVPYDVLVDATYNAYNVSLWLFNVANSFVVWVDTSQWKRWITALAKRFNQNAVWNNQYAASIASWTWVLSRKVLTYEFTKLIKSIDSGNIIGWIYSTWWASFFPIDQVNNWIWNVLPSSTLWGIDTKKKSFIVTSWWVDYLVVASGNSLISYATSAWAPTWNALSTLVMPVYYSIIDVSLAWVNGNSVFCMNVWRSAHQERRYALYWHIVLVSSLWILTLTNSTQIYDPDPISQPFSLQPVYAHFRCSTDQVGTTIYVYASFMSWHWNNGGKRFFRDLFSINTTNINVFTFSNIRNELPTPIEQDSWAFCREIVWWRNIATNKYLYVREHSLDIFEMDWSSNVDTWVNYFGVWEFDLCLKKNTTTKLSTPTDNAYITDTLRQFRVDNVLANWNLSWINYTRIIKHTWTWSEETHVQGIFANCIALWINQPSEKVLLKESWDTLVTLETMLPNTLQPTLIINFNMIIPLTNFVTWKARLSFELEAQNTMVRQRKLWFWLIWGTFASPTWTNGSFSWDATTWTTLTWSSSVINLSIE